MSGPNDGGWIKLHRRFLRSAIWQNPNVRIFWVWCLLKATHTPITQMVGLKRISLVPGQFLYNHSMASIETGMSLKVVRLCVESLRAGSSPEIGQAKGRQLGNRFSIITILNWDVYQGVGDSEGRLRAGKRAGKGQAEGRLINKEDKNVKKEGGKIVPVDVAWNGEKLVVPTVFMEKYTAKYPRLDVGSIIIDAERWLLKHPAKAAGYKSFDAFLNNWLRGEEENRRKRDGDDSDYELTGDSLAAAIECATLFGRAGNE